MSTIRGLQNPVDETTLPRGCYDVLTAQRKWNPPDNHHLVEISPVRNPSILWGDPIGHIPRRPLVKDNVVYDSVRDFFAEGAIPGVHQRHGNHQILTGENVPGMGVSSLVQ